jgi:hypothetical protein
MYSVGNQYAEASASASHVVRPPSSDCGVVDASTARFPMYVWLCDLPGWPAKTIASSLLRWLIPQASAK